ncbi:unnamed protein product [Trifolium pratense]|uniref:Uncharacterized protein n=1 Tax=Trifolium pratense TaxID=57577 RepID=A0ACB0JUF3_TRIPR|nr:unnamed protein product [Trifolium pratense]
MSAPLRRIDEILALPYSVDGFKAQEVPPSDDDSSLYNGEEELNSALMERQKEMEFYDLKHKTCGNLLTWCQVTRELKLLMTDDSDDESDGIESAEDNDEEDTFMRPYSDAMNEELKETTLQKSFVRADEQIRKKDGGTSHAAEDMDNDFSPVDVDVNLL